MLARHEALEMAISLLEQTGRSPALFMQHAANNDNETEYRRLLHDDLPDLVHDSLFLVDLGGWELFKNDIEARGVIFPKYEPVASHGDPIHAQNDLPEA